MTDRLHKNGSLSRATLIRELLHHNNYEKTAITKKLHFNHLTVFRSCKLPMAMHILSLTLSKYVEPT